jgi:quercetin dioxygenase-like cupin family protein
MVADMATVIPIESIRRSERAALFEGGDEAPVSMFITQYDRGQGPNLHFHPYPEVFVVQEGTAVFTAGDEQLTVAAGNIVTVPAETVHGFKSAADEKLRVLSVHPSPHVVQTDL